MNLGRMKVDAVDLASATGTGYATVKQTGAIGASVSRSAGATIARHGTRRHALTKTLTVKRGRHRVALLRTLRATKGLTPGRYRILVQGVGADGAASKTAIAWFWVLTPKHKR